MGEKIFKPFEVTTKKRYWEDDDYGILVRRDGTFKVYEKQLRSYLLKFAIVRGDIILKEKEKCLFGFKGRILSVVGGKDKNLITILSEHGKKVNKPLITKSTIESVSNKDKVTKKKSKPVRKKVKVIKKKTGTIKTSKLESTPNIVQELPESL